MLGFFKKEEDTFMTEPLLPNDPDTFGGLAVGADQIYGNGHAFYNPPGQRTNYPQPNGGLYANGYTNLGLLQGEDGDHLMGSTFNAPDPPPFQITYEKFSERVNKVQRRRQGKKSEQRLKSDEAKVILGINVLGVAQVADVQVFVLKDPDPTYQSTEITLPPQRLATNITQNNGTYRVSVDLDSVYETEIVDPSDVTGSTTRTVKVYQLAKNKTDKVNLFKLKIVVVYVDGSQCSQYTDRAFMIIGRENKDKPSTIMECVEEEESNILPTPLLHAKRPRTDTEESACSIGSNLSSENIRLPSMTPQSNISSSSGYSTEDYCVDENVIHASKIVTEVLNAKKANIGDLIVAKPIKVKGGDIAYHFILKNPDAHPHFLEGEVVGLFANDNGERVLDKLSQKNSLDAILKGVITRSQYIEAQVQPEGVRTEPICMFGSVPVRIRGPVSRGSIVYASPEHPGMAVSGSTIGYSSSLRNDAAAIGMAWQSMKCDEDEINLVQCFVSVTMEVFQGMIEKKVIRLEKKMDLKIDTIRNARKKTRKRVYICTAIVTVFLLLLSVLIWQVFMPGTAFRYWECERGSISGHTAKFKFISLAEKLLWSWVNGIEFSWPGLEKMMKDRYSSDLTPINGTGFHYYLNVDRCAYGQMVTTTDKFANKKIVKGPLVFAVDERCKHAYYWSSVYGWCTYHSSHSLSCKPSSHHDHKKPSKPYIRYCT